MLYLWIFGNNIEEELGSVKFLGFYLTCGALAALAQWFFSSSSTIPSIGASGKQLETQEPSTIVDFTMDLLNNVFNGLNQKVSSEELQEFKIFLYQLAESITNAAGEGTFGTGVKVSPQEAKVLERLKTTLGL
jgi:hypothetical protein